MVLLIIKEEWYKKFQIMTKLSTKLITINKIGANSLWLGGLQLYCCNSWDILVIYNRKLFSSTSNCILKDNSIHYIGGVIINMDRSIDSYDTKCK